MNSLENANFNRLVILLIIFSCLLFYILIIFQTNKQHFNSNNQMISNKSKFISKKIAFCFMIYDKVANKHIWKTFFKNIDKSKYKILIHYKENKNLDWLEEYKIKDSIETCWGCYSLVEAQIILSKQALFDKDVTHCIWLSGNCLPFKSFDYVYNYLDISMSYFNKSPDSQLFPRCNPILKTIDKSNIKKAAMQSILNRNHTELIVNNRKFIKDIFSQIQIPDEIAFITILYHLKKYNELVLTNNKSFDATTYTCWTDMTNHKDFPLSIKKGQPYNFSFICEDEIKAIVNSKSLFARKFEDGCGGLDKLIKYIK